MNFDQTRESRSHINLFYLKIKYFIKQFTPPILLNFYKKIRAFKNYTFEGVYENLDDVPIKNKGHINKDWIEELCENANSIYSKIDKNQLLPPPFEGSTHHQLLPFLLSTILEKNKKIIILDFGGGTGTAIHACSTFSKIDNLEIHIIETKEFVEISKKLIEDNLHVSWHDKLPNNLNKIDILNLGSSLQYVDNYKKKLMDLIEYKPTFILFTDYYMGKAKTYATKQVNIPELVIPLWVFNLNEIISITSSKGYELVFKSTNYQKQHIFNIPEEYKVEDSCNLLFKLL